MYSFIGYNFLFGHIHYRHFSDSDHYTARFVRQIRSIYGSYSHCVSYVVTNFLPLSIYHLLFTSLLVCSTIIIIIIIIIVFV